MKAEAVLTVLTVCLSLSACHQKSITKEQAVVLIESSPAFQGPWSPGVVFLEAHPRPGPNTKRELLRLEGLVSKEDGPFGIAGSTATAAFTWRWNEGPFQGKVFRSKARFNSNSSKGWTVYEDYLRRQLWAAELGEEE